VAKFIALILITIHIHHSLVMIAGDVMQVNVVAAAVKAGIPLFEHTGGEDAGHEATDSLEVEDADICSNTSLVIDTEIRNAGSPANHTDKPRGSIFPVHVEILTPPPQA
jgi:hypothetical protein